MKTSLFRASVLGALLLTGTASAAVTTYKATLDGVQPIPPNSAPATGTAKVDFDDEKKTLVGTVNYIGLSGVPTAAHIHEGACGATGGVSLSLGNPGGSETLVNSPLSDAQIKALGAGNLYIDIHTDAHAEGEIRGQLYVPRTQRTCPADAGIDSGSEEDADAPPSGGPPNGSDKDAGNDAGTPNNGGTSSTDDSGCSTTGGAPGSSLAIALAVVAIAVIGSRGRRKRS